MLTDKDLDVINRRDRINAKFNTPLSPIMFIVTGFVTLITIYGTDTGYSIPKIHNYIYYIVTYIGFVCSSISFIFGSIIFYKINDDNWMMPRTKYGIMTYILASYTLLSYILRGTGYLFVQLMNDKLNVNYWTWYLYYIGWFILGIPTLCILSIKAYKSWYKPGYEVQSNSE